jgi:hypothetical protein
MPFKITRHKSQSKEATQQATERATELAKKHPAKPLGQRGKWVIGEDGRWREGSAAPESLREDLRELPSELVTKDPSSPDQIHELDPPHIVEDLAYQAEKREREAEAPRNIDDILKPFHAPLGEVVPITQRRVDFVRFRLIQARMKVIERKAAEGHDVDLFEPVHVWFPNDNVNEYLMHPGWPPPDVKGYWPNGRPAHLLRIHLEVDVLSPPRSIRDLLLEYDIELPDIKEQMLRETMGAMQ